MPPHAIATPGVGDSYNTFATAYGTAIHTGALAGCILRQYRCGTTLLSALFNDGICIALLSEQPRLLASSREGASVTALLHGRNGWLLAASCCPPHVLAALDDAGAETARNDATVFSLSV